MKPHEYQVRGVEFALGTPTNSCYWMVDLGLGKTLMTLMLQNQIDEPMLIIAPLRPLYSTWPAEIEKWFPGKKISILHGKDKQVQLREDADFYLMNPEGMKWLFEQRNLPFKNLVIDEGSVWKDSSTKRFRMIRKMLPKFHRRFILSGTPAPQGLMDLWSQYYILDGGERLGRTITAFRNQYFNTVMVGNMFPKYEPKPGAMDRVLERVADITFRLDSDDYIKMPPIVFNDIPLELTKDLKKQYRELEREFVLELGEDGVVEAFNAASLSSKLRQFIQGGVYEGEGSSRITHHVHDIKLSALEDLVETTGKPILCAIQFRFELDQIRKSFPDAPYIGGGTKPEDSTRVINEWNKGKIPLLLCHPKSLSHGANLQTGGHIILWYGLTWSLEQYLQLIGRLHRQGQTETVVIHHFIMQGTLDTRVAKALRKKESVQKAVLSYFRGKEKL